MSAVMGPGSTFAGYRVESLLGRGGMGVVYRATDLSLQRPVALKLIAPELAHDERFRRRFLKEPRLAASLDHPSVIPIYEAGERDGQLYLAMRYVHGCDLKTVLERERTLGPGRALRILTQIAGALDAAHRRGLVHRDVKPANILLDEDEHAYLTDFGITKQGGGASTDTGEVAGTLDYLAPEQIRGEPVDARSDEYALACVLYECLGGAPPFRRQTQAESLWAHLQEEPPPLPGYPALDLVLRKALAKEKDDRYPSCDELTEAASATLGLAAPAAEWRAPGLLRRRRAILTAGLLVLAIAIASAIVTLTAVDEPSGQPPIGNGVAAIDPSGRQIASFIEAATAPSNIAVGEGAVWVLNTENDTVSRIDPETKAVTGRFRTRHVPTDIAAGAGALWLGNGGGEGGNYTVSISRIDPRTGAVTNTVKLPDRTGTGATATFNWGRPDIVVAAGAVWALNPDHTVSRIDPGTGRLVATIDVEAGSIAAGDEGVWVAEGPAVTRIDPRSNRVGRTIRLAAEDASGIAVGAGKLWVTAQRDGVVWQIEPGPHPVTRSIAVGTGAEYVAFGAGAVWTGNYIDGTVSRIDPRTNEVSHVPVGAVQALAAGAGGAWVSTAGRPRAGTLPASVCGGLVSGGRKPDVLIASDLPLQGPGGAGPRAMADAIRLALEQRDFKAGRYTVGYRSCDESTAQTGAFEKRRCAANAGAYAGADDLVALIGPWSPYCAQVEIPILNRAPGGPLAMISPVNTHPGLTRVGPPASDGERGEPEVYYPTGVRNYVRLLAGDDLQGSALAVLAKRLALDRVYLLHERSSFWEGLLIDPFRRAAARLGVGLAGSAAFDPRTKSYDVLADTIARSGADGVVVGGDPLDGGDRLVKALRARLGARVTIMGGFFFNPRAVVKRIGRAGRGMYVTSSDLPRGILPLSAAGRRFKRDIGDPATQYVGVMEAGQAAELVMDAIARSDGTRASVLDKLFASDVKDGILGTFRFDRNGDITTASIPILRITGATPPGESLPPDFQGATLDRLVQVPTDLVK
jgi:ABC-type branched-subunit amino acid transport system substrate-binding protein/DNA-binding beta-propeller fold protein YncE/predicted Ser/Thr protein kinase